ncbi:MAG: neutral zinc metallopeptidase [Gammaproteobacteria bacterium]
MTQDRYRQRARTAGRTSSPVGVRRFIPWVALPVALAAAYLLWRDDSPVPGQAGNGGVAAKPALSAPPSDPAQVAGQAGDPESTFVTAVLADTQVAWQALLAETGSTYAPPVLELFSSTVGRACGFADVAMGPFYCPAERKIYLDLDFIGALRKRVPGSGDYAVAYVVAHEVGHHVQALLGTAELARQLLDTSNEEESGTIALIVELQADCYAGMWVQHAGGIRDRLGGADVDEALFATTTLGGELLRTKAPGAALPDPFNHGSAEQRASWFRTGLKATSIQDCETFAAPEL